MNFAIALKDEKVGAYEVRIGDMKDGEFGEKLTINGLSFYGSAGSSYQGMLD